MQPHLAGIKRSWTQGPGDKHPDSKNVACLLGWLVRRNRTQVRDSTEPVVPQDWSILLAEFEGSNEELQLWWLSTCVNDDERARLGAQAIKRGSTAVFAAGAANIVAMAGATNSMVPDFSVKRNKIKRATRTTGSSAELPADTGAPTPTQRKHEQRDQINATSAVENLCNGRCAHCNRY